MSQPIPMKPVLRQLTSEERARIRDLLDRHFNEDGWYENGYSDLKIAQQCNVPAADVTHIRDIGYGPILGDPEIVALKNEIASVRSEIGNLLTNLGGAEKRVADLDRRVDELKKRIVP